MPLLRTADINSEALPPADLVIGKLKRLDPEDVSDINFLIDRFRLTEADLKEAFDRLPARLKADPVVQDNLRFVMEDHR